MRLLVVAVMAFGCAARPAPPPTTPAPPPPPVAQTPLAQLESAHDLDGVVIGASRAATVVVVMASWCGHCRDQLVLYARVRDRYPQVRWLALNYKGHEEYDHRGNSVAIRELAAETPWLRVVPAGEELFSAFGRPPKIPTIFVYDSAGALVETFDRRERPVPDEHALDALLSGLR